MSRNSSKKLKKPLDLPLGKAAVQKEEVDLSQVRLPIETSIFGLNQALTLFRTATSEVKRYLAYECELMYECRKCRSIFRSLANFILHKRKYCRDKNEDTSQGPKGDRSSYVQKDIEAANKIIANDDSDDKNPPKRLLNPIIEKLLKKQEHAKFVQDVKNEKLDHTKIREPRTGDVLNNMFLESIDTSKVAVFQTAAPEATLGETEFMKAEVMEIHSIFDDNEIAVGTDGKAISFKNEDKPKKSLCCTECDLKFSTKKTLSYHIKYKHNKSRLVYPCPECKEVLANAWCVYRHLLKVHRKTTTQIRKYRTQIHNSAICRKVDETPKVKKEPKEVKEENDEENEWLDNFEGDNDFQMCGGCGKRFERKAALTSHSVMCTKRIAICNSIKENHAKKKENDDKESKTKNKTNKSNRRQVGSSKRKPESLISYKVKTEILEENHKIDENCIETRDNQNGAIEGIDNEDRLLDDLDEVSDSDLSPCRGFESEDSKYHISLNLLINSFSETNRVIHNLKAESDESRSIETPVENIENISKISTDNESSTGKDSIDECEIESPNENSGKNSIDGVDSIESSPEKCEKCSIDGVISIESSPAKNSTDSEMESSTEKLSNDDGESESDSKSIENSSVISLNNNNSDENFDLLLCYNQSEECNNVSFQSLIKSMINDQNEVEQQDENIEHRANEFVITVVPEDRLTAPVENSIAKDPLSVECETGESQCKRKRSISQDEIQIKKFCEPDDVLTSENEDDVFISRLTEYTDMQTFSCTLCNTQFSSLSHLLLHMSIHFSWYRYQCSKCSFMSYNRFDCESHAHREHQVPFNKMQNMVLPIPTWKTILISDNSMNLEPLDSPTVEEDEDNDTKENIIIEPMPEQFIVGFIDLTTDLDDDDEDMNEMKRIREDHSYISSGGSAIDESKDSVDGVLQSMSKQAILEVILGNEQKVEVENSAVDYPKQTRNRVKSVKASQKDFIYDMDRVSRKIKGNCSDIVQKQLKITDENV